MSVGTRLFTWLHGELVGTDKFGNRYYRMKNQGALVKGGGMDSRERRWVLYSGQVEASKVPAEWHGWLHHITNDLPDANAPRRAWQREHQPNLTGTAHAYHPAGSIVRGGHRAPAAGDYEAWKP